MILIVDASVAIKWVLPEPDSHVALALRTDERLFSAPSLIIEEISNIAWKYVRRGELNRDKSLVVARVAIGLVHVIAPAAELYERALTLAIDLDHPIYDCFYLALAAREGAPVVTADARLAKLAERIGVTVERL
jgi:predicted nucleic acid-binding protein